MENLEKELEKLLSLQVVYKQQAEKFARARFLFPILMNDLKKPHITGISGLRGAGKTVLLLQLLKKVQDSFYISLDFLTSDLFQIANELVKRYKIKYLFLDEIHYYPNWSRYLKQIYDVLKIKVVFTSSVSLDILSAKEDLSRRVLIYNLPVLSFREFLNLSYDKNFSKENFEEIFKSEYKKADLELETIFSEYLKFPLASQLEDKTPQLVNNIIEKIIVSDLNNIKSLNSEDKLKIKQTLQFLANIEGGDISLTALAFNLKITKYKMKSYLELLEKAFLIHQVYPIGKNVLKEPKILLNLPFRLYLSSLPQERIVGPLKEDFFISMIKGVGKEIYYLKNKRGRKLPDFMIKEGNRKYIVEIGGKAKTFSQFKGIKIDKKFITTYPFALKPNTIPLYKFGMLY